MRVYHLREEDWVVTCNICGKKFAKKAFLVRHISRSHPDVGPELGIMELQERNPKWVVLLS